MLTGNPIQSYIDRLAIFQNNLETSLMFNLLNKILAILCKWDLSLLSLCLIKIKAWTRICSSQFNRIIENLQWHFHKLPLLSVSIPTIQANKFSIRSKNPMMTFLVSSQLKTHRINMPMQECTMAYPLEI